MGCDSVDEAYLEGFEERERERGVVHGRWVQQPLILQHPSIGCLVNHCGFGSMWESLICDFQFVFVPHLGDQILNTRLLASALNVARKLREMKMAASQMSKGDEVCEMLKRNNGKCIGLSRKEDFMSGYIDVIL